MGALLAVGGRLGHSILGAPSFSSSSKPLFSHSAHGPSTKYPFCTVQHQRIDNIYQAKVHTSTEQGTKDAEKSNCCTTPYDPNIIKCPSSQGEVAFDFIIKGSAAVKKKPAAAAQLQRREHAAVTKAHKSRKARRGLSRGERYKSPLN